MIYHSNASPHERHLVFIGRWSPFHRGHAAVIQSKRNDHPGLPVLIMVRDRKTERYPATVRAEYIKRWMLEQHIRGTIMIIPDIEGVYWGREVGYHVGEVRVPESVRRISGTHIRNAITKDQPDWKRLVASGASSPMLSPRISRIIDRGFVVWLTGCPASGKSTIADLLRQRLTGLFPYLRITVLDGDDMRMTPLAKHVGYSKTDRADHIRRMGYLARMFAETGTLVICAFVSPDRSVRKDVRDMVGPDRFLEVYVRASMRTRIARDTKGLYKKASRGLLSNLTGFNAVYEHPIRPDVTCDTDRMSATECVNAVLVKITG